MVTIKPITSFDCFQQQSFRGFLRIQNISWKIRYLMQFLEQLPNRLHLNGSFLIQNISWKIRYLMQFLEQLPNRLHLNGSFFIVLSGYLNKIEITGFMSLSTNSANYSWVPNKRRGLHNRMDWKFPRYLISGRVMGRGGVLINGGMRKSNN